MKMVWASKSLLSVVDHWLQQQGKARSFLFELCSQVQEGRSLDRGGNVPRESSRAEAWKRRVWLVVAVVG